MMFFILELWSLSTSTLYLYSGLELEAAQLRYCAELNSGNALDRMSSQNVSPQDCDKLKVLSGWRYTLNVCTVTCSVFGAYVSIRLSEKIQEDATLEKKRR